VNASVVQDAEGPFARAWQQPNTGVSARAPFHTIWSFSISAILS